MFQNLVGFSAQRVGSFSRQLLALCGLGLIAGLAGCGGGGTTEGAPFNPAPQPPATPALTVSPGSAVLYEGVTTTFTIQGGNPPYRAFSSDSVVLPVTQNVSGSFLIVTPQNVPEAGGVGGNNGSAVTITVQDAAGRSTPVTVNIIKATLSTTGIVVTVPTSGKCSPALCADQEALATISLKGPFGAALANRQVRFEVVLGEYNFVLDSTGTLIAKAVTVTTDGAGIARVLIKADKAAKTALALIRATDLTTGQRMEKDFSITEVVVKPDDPPVLAVTPDKIEITTTYNDGCSAGVDTYFYIYGGVAPYRVDSSIPDSVVLANSNIPGSQFGRTTNVAARGGYFIARTTGGCVNPATLLITDAAGKTTTVTVVNKAGSATRPVITPPDPTALIMRPDNIAFTGTNNSCFPTDTSFNIQGGTPPYRITLSRPERAALQDLNPVSISLPGIYQLPAGVTTFRLRYLTYLANGETFVVSLVDATSKEVTTTFSCTATPPAVVTPVLPDPLVIAPVSAVVPTTTTTTTAGTPPVTTTITQCLGSSIALSYGFTINGGVGPYRIALSDPAFSIQGVTATVPGIYNLPGASFAVVRPTSVANYSSGSTLVTISIVDSKSNGTQASIRCGG